MNEGGNTSRFVLWRGLLFFVYVGGVVMLLKTFGAILTLCGALVLFDARRLVKKYFDYGEENNATTGMKGLGFFVLAVGGILMIV